MKSRVTLAIGGMEYTVVSEESEEYIRKSARLVDQNIAEIKAASSLSSLTCAVLAAMNIADKYYKAEESCENMRAQIQSYAEECAQLRSELNKLRKNR